MPRVRHFRRNTPVAATPVMALAIALCGALAGCDRSVPPNVTPPGETAAFSDPSPAAAAAPETETRK